MDELKAALRQLIIAEMPIGIVSHVNPDGDGFCASLFMAGWLKLHGRDAVIITDGDDLERFSHLLGDAQVISYKDDMSFSSLVVLDCNSMSRLGKRAELVNRAERVWLIDHHEVEHGLIPAHHSFIDQTHVCVGAILFSALEQELTALPEADRTYLASCLYTTILNDTNNFTNGNTDAAVLELSGRVCALGIKPHLLYRAYFQNQSWQEMRYTGEVLSTIEVHHGGRLEGQRPRPDAGHLGKAGDGDGRPADQPPAMAGREELVVAHQTAEQAPRAKVRNQRQRQRGLARPGRPGNEQAAVAHQQGGAVDVLLTHQPSAGRATTKRAPLISPGLVPGMFSAVSVPPCASTIWRLMDRPRPEFCPNASLDGRSV